MGTGQKPKDNPASDKKLRRKEKRRGDKRSGSKNLTNAVRKHWDFESRQNRRWLIAKQIEGSISTAAADIVHRWIRAKTPAEQERLPKPSQFMLPNPALNEAWSAWAMLKEERKDAIVRGTSVVKANDWWDIGASEVGENQSMYDAYMDEMEEGDDGGEEEDDEGDDDDEEEEEEEDGGV